MKSLEWALHTVSQGRLALPTARPTHALSGSTRAHTKSLRLRPFDLILAWQWGWWYRAIVVRISTCRKPFGSPPPSHTRLLSRFTIVWNASVMMLRFTILLNREKPWCNRPVTVSSAPSADVTIPVPVLTQVSTLVACGLFNHLQHKECFPMTSVVLSKVVISDLQMWPYQSALRAVYPLHCWQLSYPHFEPMHPLPEQHALHPIHVAQSAPIVPLQ